MTVTLLTVSLVTLLLSLIILRAFRWCNFRNKLYHRHKYFRSLHCVRNTIHSNMFISIALNNVCWLFWWVIIEFHILCKYDLRDHFMVSLHFNFDDLNTWRKFKMRCGEDNMILFHFRYHLVLYDPGTWSANSIWCRGLHIMTTYFMMTTYFWMLCEGMFLRMILVNTFVEEEECLVFMYIIGWLSPALTILPYIIYRIFYEDTHCWMDPGKFSFRHLRDH